MINYRYVCIVLYFWPCIFPHFSLSVFSISNMPVQNNLLESVLSTMWVLAMKFRSKTHLNTPLFLNHRLVWDFAYLLKSGVSRPIFYYHKEVKVTTSKCHISFLSGVCLFETGSCHVFLACRKCGLLLPHHLPLPRPRLPACRLSQLQIATHFSKHSFCFLFRYNYFEVEYYLKWLLNFMALCKGCNLRALQIKILGYYKKQYL